MMDELLAPEVLPYGIVNLTESMYQITLRRCHPLIGDVTGSGTVAY